MSRIPESVVAAIKMRDCGICIRCGAQAVDIHHRRARGMGGTRIGEHDLARLASLCRACHQWAESRSAEAYNTGWAIHQGDPDACEEIPVVDRWGRLWLLTDDGRRVMIR